MKIIGFTGGMGTGKTTAIEFLKDIEGSEKIKLVKFAGPIYDIQEMVYRRISSVYTRPDTFVKDRKLLQWLGTDWGRGIRQDLWVSLWKADVEAAKTNPVSRPKIIVCDDIRFDNEAETVKSMGGLIVKITSSRAAERIDTGAGIKEHASESGISSNFIDFTLQNNGSVGEFKDAVTSFYEATNKIGKR